MSSPLQEAVARVRSHLGCGDHSCRYARPVGMGTNGGCRCLEELSSRGLIRALHALIRVAGAHEVSR